MPVMVMMVMVMVTMYLVMVISVSMPILRHRRFREQNHSAYGQQACNHR